MRYFSNEMFSLVKNGVYSSKHWNKESYKDCSFAAMVATFISRKQIHVIYFSNLHFFFNLSLNLQAIVKIVLKVRVIVYFDLTILQGRANSSKTVFGALRRLSKYINE